MIKVILFDSGKVLNRPITGHWFMPPHFWKYVDKEKYKKLSSSKIAHAFSEANKYIESQRTILTKEEEYRHFIQFYTIFSEYLPELEIDSTKIELLTKDLVYNSQKYVFYEDALQIIPHLRKKYRLGIVSDAWPSLLDVYKEQKFEEYFECFVISSMVGVTKPHEKMYITALNELGIVAEQAVFIDDSLKNCYGAMKLGMKSILLCRNKWWYLWNKIMSLGKGYTVIYTLKDLEKILST